MEEQLYRMLIESKGKIDNFVFIASDSFGTDLKEFQGIPIYYNNLIQKDVIIYCETPFVSNLNSLYNG